MPGHTNPQGSVFGGVLLSLIDQAAWVEALRQSNRRWVTVAFEKVEFTNPVYVGDILSLYGETMKIGRTSLRVRVRVEAFRPEQGQQIEVTHGEVVLVSVDADGAPTPIDDEATTTTGVH